MCRMAAYLGPPRSPAELLFDGDHSLEAQSYRPRELVHGHVNVDGYGVAWYHERKPVRIAEARPLWHDPDLEPLLRTIRASPILAAVRNITPGILPERSGVPPLLFGRWSFVLNGSLESFRARAMRRFHALLPDDLFAHLRGTSDTEALFLLVVKFARDGLPLPQALHRVIRTATETADELGLEARLNLIVSDGRTIAASRFASSGAQDPLYVAVGGAEGGAGVVIASEPLDSAEVWQPVPDSSLVAVDGDGSVEFQALAG